MFSADFLILLRLSNKGRTAIFDVQNITIQSQDSRCMFKADLVVNPQGE